MPVHSNSLLTRLLVRVVIICLIAIGATFATVNYQIDHSLELLRDQTVEEQARDIKNYLVPGKGGNKVALNMPDHLRVFYAKAGPAYQYIVRDTAGQILFRSPFAYPDYVPKDFSNLGDGLFEFKGPSGYDNVGITIKARVGDRDYYVQAAQSRQAAEFFSEQISDNFMTRFLMVGLPFYAVLILIILLTLKRGFTPLHDAAKAAEKASAHTPEFQIPETGLPDEALPFVKAINVSFRRLSRSIQEQKELTENLAHELRTPLAVLKANIEGLGRTDKTAKVLRDVDAMTKLVNQMLDMTRLEYADTLEMRVFDLSGVLSQVCQDLWPLFLKVGRELRVSGIDAPAMVTGDKDLVYRAIRNVLDNALEHSPAKTPVDVSINGCVIRVRDYGPAIPEGERGRIFNRLQRLSDRAAAKSGAGLGLSIVSKTMEVHGGRAALEAADGEGNIFILDFKALDRDLIAAE